MSNKENNAINNDALHSIMYRESDGVYSMMY
jgi:hypothetical protein